MPRKTMTKSKATTKRRVTKNTGGKAKSRVNEAGNYTKPTMRKNLFNKIKAGGNNQKEILLRRGKAMSGAPIINGTNQLPKPPIITGITKIG